METLFTWLHLSDLHLGPASAAEGAPEGSPVPGEAPAGVLAALRHDILERAARPGGSVDALAVTGDVVSAGSRDECAAARRWLVELGRALGLGADRIFLVAGNHDVDRVAAARNEGLELRLLAELREGRRRLDAALDKANARAVLAARLAPFAELAASFGTRSTDQRLEWSHRIEGRSGLRVRLVGLCTAWLALDDTDQGKLYLGGGPLARAESAIGAGELVVALSHHPLRGGWLADEHDADVWMNANAHVHLTGHVHDTGAEAARAGVAGPCVWIAAGASDPGAPARRLGWSLASVMRSADGALAVRVSPRRWSQGNQRFVPDENAVRDGRPFAEHALRLRLAPAEPPSTRAPFVAGSTAPRPIPARPAPEVARTTTTPRPVPPRNVSEVSSKEREREWERERDRERERNRTPRPRAPSSEPVLEIHPRPEKVSRVTPRRPPEAGARYDAAPRSVGRAPMGSGIGFFEGPGALPASPVAYFAGREDELTALCAALAEPGVTCVVVTGLGGVGKTSMMQHFVATDGRALFDETAWIDGRDLPAELGRVAKRFGFAGEDRSAGASEAGAFVRRALEGRRMLLVIDNVDPGTASVRAFPVPPAGSRSRLVVVSRILTLHEDLGRLARPLRLGTWDDATCRAHLREVVPALEDEPDAELDQLAQRAGGLPLAVRLIAKQLARPGVTVRGLLDRMDRDPLATLDAPSRGAERTLAATFQAALDGLGDAEQGVLIALAVCAPATRAEVVAAVAGVRADEASMALEGLSEQSLVEWQPEADDPFRLHVVVRMVLGSLPGAGSAEAAHEAWVMMRVAENRAAGRSAALEADVGEVLAVVERRARRGDGAGAWEALSPIVGVLDRRGMYAEMTAAATQVLAVVPEDSIEASAVQANLGVAWCSLGEIGRALGCFEQALAVAVARRWPPGQAVALGGLGRCYAVQGEWSKAIEHHRRAAAIDEREGERVAFANDLGNIGLAYRRSGDVNSAIDYLGRALALHEELDQPDGRAEVLGGLGLCFRDIGELDRAVDCFERALAIHVERGRRVGEATMLGNLGNTHRTLGDVESARNYLEQALAIYEKLGLLDGQGAALGNLGACYRALGDQAKARDHYERALAVLRRAGLPDDHPHVKAVAAALGQASRAGARSLREG
jgi:tetratricopeptide (TPR) repeat protein